MPISFLLVLCLALPPVEGPVVAGFTPTTQYGGHWGVDIATQPGTDVIAPDDGVVTFAGRVAGMRSVTIRVADDVRVSLSYLSTIEVSTGTRVRSGTIIGRSGLAHGDAALHLSVRVEDRYVDPIGFLGCRRGTIRLLADR